MTNNDDVTDGGGVGGNTDNVWWCPWCESVIAIDGMLARTEAEAYWHSYEHMDKGPYAVDVMEAFEPLSVVNVDTGSL